MSSTWSFVYRYEGNLTHLTTTSPDLHTDLRTPGYVGGGGIPCIGQREGILSSLSRDSVLSRSTRSSPDS